MVIFNDTAANDMNIHVIDQQFRGHERLTLCGIELNIWTRQ